MEEQKKTIRFPARELTLDVFECPCGGNGLRRFRSYHTGLDDADPDWGGYNEVYGFSLQDPCFRKYSVEQLDWQRNEFVLQILDQTETET